jgi:hypothetical protein
MYSMTDVTQKSIDKDELEKALARISKLEDALRWYENQENYREKLTTDRNAPMPYWVSDVEKDKGQRAREALRDEN